MKNNKSIGNFVFISSILFMIAVLCSTVMADTDTILPGGSIRISMISQIPDPVAPGEYLELRFMVTNLGSKPLEDVEFKLVPDYPFQLLGLDTGIKSLGTIQGHQKGEEGLVLYYKVRIDEAASEGINKLDLMYRFKGVEDWTKLDYFSIRVRNLYAAVVIDSFDVQPSVIAPGSVGKLNIKVTNMAGTTMKDVDLKLDLTLSSIPRSATGAESSLLFDALPFTPIGSSGEKRLGNLKSGKDAIFSFDLMVYPGATSKVYKVPIMLSYNDDQGNLSARSDLVSIVVGASPDIYAVIDKSDLVAGKKSGIISFKFVNRGVTDIKFLDVLLKNTDEYDVVSSQEEYVGNVNSDDYETVDYSLYLKNNVDKKRSSSIMFPLRIMFKDANNVDYSKDINLTYKIYTAQEKGTAQSSSLWIIVSVVVLMLFIWIVYRKWEKRRKEKKAQ
jgi:hypothetical protein